MQIVNTEVKEYLELNFKNVRQTEKGFRINVEQLDKTDLVLLVGFFIIYCCGFFIGRDSNETEIENLEKTIKTETITQQQLEYIIFNEIQE